MCVGKRKMSHGNLFIFCIFIIFDFTEKRKFHKKIGERIVLAHSCHQSIGQTCTFLFDSNMTKNNIYSNFDSLYD